MLLHNNTKLLTCSESVSGLKQVTKLVSHTDNHASQEIRKIPSYWAELLSGWHGRGSVLERLTCTLSTFKGFKKRKLCTSVNQLFL